MNVSAFKVTILYMFVHVNDIFSKLFICTYIFFEKYKNPELQQSGVFFTSVYLIV